MPPTSVCIILLCFARCGKEKRTLRVLKMCMQAYRSVCVCVCVVIGTAYLPVLEGIVVAVMVVVRYDGVEKWSGVWEPKRLCMRGG